MPQKINKQQLEQILQKAPQGVAAGDIIAGLRSRGYEIEGLPAAEPPKTAGPAAAAPAKKGFMQKAGDFLFGNTGKFVGTAVGRAGELAAIAADPVARERAMNASPEEFKRIFPFLGRNVDQKASKVAKQTAGEGIGSAAELALMASGVPGAGSSTHGVKLMSKEFLKAAGPRILRGGAFGAAGGASQGLQRDESLAEIGSRTASGFGTGVVFSSAMELLAKAGDVAAKKFMDSALNPYKKDIGKVERLVDDKTLAERLNEKGVSGTNKSIVKKLKRLEHEAGARLDKILKESGDEMIAGYDIVKDLDKVKDSPYVPQDMRSGAELAEIIAQRKKMYIEKETFTLAEALREKRGIGRRIGGKAFAMDSESLRKITNEKLVDRAIYDALKTELENRSIDPGLVRQLNQDMSTYIDGINLFTNAQTRGVKLLNVLSAIGGAGVGAMITGTASGAGMAGAGIGLTYAGLRTTLAKTLLAQLGNQGQKLTQDAAQRVIDRIITQLTNPAVEAEAAK